jgi:hypothetical protein
MLKIREIFLQAIIIITEKTQKKRSFLIVSFKISRKWVQGQRD